MKINRFIYATFLLILFVNVNAQTKSERAEIVKNYDLENLAFLANKYKLLAIEQKAEAVNVANENNWPIKFTDSNGSYNELIRLDDGKPVYYKTYNRNASRSTRTKWLNTGGGMGLDVNGEGMTAYVWDGGHALPTHNEFSDASGGASRIEIGDAATASPSEHGTHVCGTIISYGSSASAKGMAPKANIKSFDWSGDFGEIYSEISDGMLISNHSYGIGVSSSGGVDIEDWKIGAYTSQSKQWDILMYAVPYYLKVIAAGNDGNDNVSNAAPMEGNGLYDKMIEDCVSKNPLVVAAGTDLSVNASGEIVSAINIANFSSEGPTDDYRIKPDITGNGTGVYSAIETSNSSYASFDGTSMASPNVMGSLLLLQQLNNEENGEFLLSSTLKGLVLHTADDGGTVGPDAKFGWGYLNTKKAAECILNDGTTTEVQVYELEQGGEYTFTVTSDALNPLQASICWTDKESTNTATSIDDLNRTEPMLVNDLDIRISKDGITYMPWKLTSVNSNAKADNNVDVFERIDIDDASGDYTITVSHKGDLYSGSQTFSLVVTGITQFVGTNNQNFSKFRIWPNPSKGIFTLNVDNTADLAITISNLLGEVVHSEMILNQTSITKQFDLSHLVSGVYTVTVDDGEKQSTNKIIIE